MTYERACTAHSADPYEAEPVQHGNILYAVLRCPTCHRPQGERLIRRANRVEWLANYIRSHQS